MNSARSSGVGRSMAARKIFWADLAMAFMGISRYASGSKVQCAIGIAISHGQAWILAFCAAGYASSNSACSQARA
jgi:hypothetical protein